MCNQFHSSASLADCKFQTEYHFQPSLLKIFHNFRNRKTFNFLTAQFNIKASEAQKFSDCIAFALIIVSQIAIFLVCESSLIIIKSYYFALFSVRLEFSSLLIKRHVNVVIVSIAQNHSALHIKSRFVNETKLATTEKSVIIKFSESSRLCNVVDVASRCNWN